MRVRIDRDDVTRAFEMVQSDGSFAESRRLHAAGLPIVEMLQALALRPEILASFASFGAGVYPGGVLERALKEKVILKASLLNDCQFCTRSHESLMRQLGITDDPIAAVADDAVLDERERAALEYTTVVTRDANRVDDALFERLRGLFTDPEIVELTYVIGLINMLNRFNNALGIRYSGEYEQAPAGGATGGTDDPVTDGRDGPSRSG